MSFWLKLSDQTSEVSKSMNDKCYKYSLHNSEEKAFKERGNC